MADKFTMVYVEKERERCAQLCAVLARGADKDFLIHCINYSVQPSEIKERRARFAEFPSAPADDIEDLM